MKHLKKSILILLAMIFAMSMVMVGCGSSSEEASAAGSSAAVSDEEAAAAVDELIAAIQVQEYTEDTEAQCKAAKEAWDALT